MGNTIYRKAVTAYTVRLNAFDCPTCGVIYGLPSDLEERRRMDGGTWYCPNGHPIVFTESEVDKHRSRAEQLAKDLAFSNAHLDKVLVELNAKSKELKRVERRINAGMCPDCRRHFTNLERHRTSKHNE